ncbi:hypothetical protein ACFYXS_39185 [Streptomyces sp. NPDC002574]|uniref:hypothetical protein n=1 Tax=Streptomyces sp. NPDC002574 TaxID=3364652 RepID=UPI00368B49D5
MHVSGVVLAVGFFWIPAVSAVTYGQTAGLMAWLLMVHVVLQIPAGLLASRWAARGQVLRAGPAALGLATAVTWALYLCAGREPSMQALWAQSWGCLCVSLCAYVWLCTLRRSTVERLAGRFAEAFQELAAWALLRPPRRGPH